uniref:Uncharacterized protein n=1 Tax=Anguilla anguilla TaxID=7936 RepID=A0A0E9RZS2_ANGAN
MPVESIMALSCLAIALMPFTDCKYLFFLCYWFKF